MLNGDAETLRSSPIASDDSNMVGSVESPSNAFVTS